MTVNPPCRPRNPVAKAVRTPLYKMRVVESKRRKLLEKWTEAVSRGAKDVKGGYATVLEGAYFAQSLALARQEARIGKLAADPLLRTKLFLDLGGTGTKADAFVIWVCQFVGREIRVLNYYEAVGQPLSTHLAWLHAQALSPANADIWLPHDGSTHDRIFDVSYESALRQAGFAVEVIPNQGRGAAMVRIESARRLFGSIWFNEATTTPGL